MEGLFSLLPAACHPDTRLHGFCSRLLLPRAVSQVSPPSLHRALRASTLCSTKLTRVQICISSHQWSERRRKGAWQPSLCLEWLLPTHCTESRRRSPAEHGSPALAKLGTAQAHCNQCGSPPAQKLRSLVLIPQSHTLGLLHQAGLANLPKVTQEVKPGKIE